MSQDQGSIEIVDALGENEARAPQSEARADLLERLYVDEGRSTRAMIRRFGPGVVDELLALGLEVDGVAPAGCVSTWDLLPTLPVQESFDSIEACVVDFLNTTPDANRSRLRMYP